MTSFGVLTNHLTSLIRPAIRLQQLPTRSFIPSLDQIGLKRLSSTVRGKSGRKYVVQNVLGRWLKTSEFNIHRAECQGQSLVTKRVPPSFFQLSQELRKEFPHSQRLRMHVDYNEKEHVLVYNYYKQTFLALLSKYPAFPPTEIKKILRCTAEAVKELHDKDWIHIDIKPDNILVDWDYDDKGQPKVEKVVLGDFDLALKLVDDQPLRAPHAVGNVMWRSPEGQSGKGVAKASDIYSLGLLCIYGLGGGSMLILDNDTIKQLKENGMPPEQEIVVRHFMYFGPLPNALLSHVCDEQWTTLFREASEMAEIEAAEYPNWRFERWSEDDAIHLTPEAKSMITHMVRLDPAQRASIDEVLKHPWWCM
ncbi:hypothetical protein diail_1964 [Diaporthe ilicicola]|nr:hypothetical protein diail_1964 [Diaporthe ilicicola]